MKHSELITLLAERTDLTQKKTKEVVNALVEIIRDEPKEDKETVINGLGTFKTSTRAAREGVNPKNPEQTIQIPETKVMSLKVSKTIKDFLNNK